MRLARQVPNLITLARLVLASAAFWFMGDVLHSEPGSLRAVDAAGIAFWLFLIASVTDFIDGHLARKYGWVSALGRIGDSVVDKVLTVGTMSYLAAGSATAAVGAGHFGVDGDVMRVMPVWALVITLAREFLITALRGLVESRGMQFPADRFGKLKMVLQVIYLSAALGGVSVVIEGGSLHLLEVARDPWLMAGVFWAMMGLTVASGIHYVTRGARMLSGNES